MSHPFVGDMYLKGVIEGIKGHQGHARVSRGLLQEVREAGQQARLYQHSHLLLITPGCQIGEGPRCLFSQFSIILQ